MSSGPPAPIVLPGSTPAILTASSPTIFANTGPQVQYTVEPVPMPPQGGNGGGPPGYSTGSCNRQFIMTRDLGKNYQPTSSSLALEMAVNGPPGQGPSDADNMFMRPGFMYHFRSAILPFVTRQTANGYPGWFVVPNLDSRAALGQPIVAGSGQGGP